MTSTWRRPSSRPESSPRSGPCWRADESDLGDLASGPAVAVPGPASRIHASGPTITRTSLPTWSLGDGGSCQEVVCAFLAEVPKDWTGDVATLACTARQSGPSLVG